MAKVIKNYQKSIMVIPATLPLANPLNQFRELELPYLDDGIEANGIRINDLTLSVSVSPSLNTEIGYAITAIDTQPLFELDFNLGILSKSTIAAVMSNMILSGETYAQSSQVSLINPEAIYTKSTDKNFRYVYGKSLYICELREHENESAVRLNITINYDRVLLTSDEILAVRPM